MLIANIFLGLNYDNNSYKTISLFYLGDKIFLNFPNILLNIVSFLG